MKEAIYSWIKCLAIFYILLTMLIHLVPTGKYQRYVRFFMGLLLMVMLITPMLSILEKAKTLPESFSSWIACAPHDGVAHATTAHRTFLRCTRTEDGGVQFPPELLAAGGRCSVYAVDQTGTMRVAEVRLPKPKPVPASTEPKANGQTGDAPAQP